MTHRLLSRQLKKIELNEETPPTLEQWQEFIQSVDQTYTTSDRDRLLMEQSRDISSRKMQELFEQSLQATEKQSATETLKYVELIESANTIMFSADCDGLITHVNPAFEKLCGSTKADLLGKHFLTVVRSDYHEEASHFYEKQIEQLLPSTYFEYPLALTGDKEIWLGQNVQLILDTGKIAGFQAIARDISEGKQTERQLALKNSALQAAANGIVITDRDGTVLWVNRAFTELTQYEAEEAVGRTPRLLKSDMQEPAFYEEMWQTIAAGEVWHGEIVNRRKDGSLYTEEMTITPVRGQEGKISHYIAIKQDVSERKEREGQFKKNQQSQETLYNLLNLSLEQGTVEELLQRSLDLILSMPWLTVQAKGSIFLTDDENKDTLSLTVHRDLAVPLQTQCARVPFGHCLCGQAAATGKTIFANCVDNRHVIQYDGMQGHGHYNVPILLNNQVKGVINLYVEEGHERDEQEVSFLEAAAKTIAGLIRRKQTEEAMQESESQFRRLSEATLEGILIHEDGWIIETNNALAQMTGYDISELPGTSAFQLVAPDYREQVQKNFVTGYEQPYEIEGLRKDGTSFPAELIARQMPFHGRTVRVATVRDITERKKLEFELHEVLQLRSRQFDISKALAEARTEAEVVQAIIREAAYFPNTGLSIFMAEQDIEEGYLVLQAQDPFDSGLTPLPVRTRISTNEMQLIASPHNIFVTGNILKDDRANFDILKIARTAGFVSWASFPIIAGDDWFGTLMVANKGVDFFDDKIIALYQSIAEQSAVALRATRLFNDVEQSLERRSRQVEISTRIAQEIAAAPDLTNLYERVVTLIKEAFGYYHVQLLRYDPGLDVLALVVGYGEVGEQMVAMNHSMPMAVGLIGTAASSRRSVLRPNVAEDPNWQSNILLPDTKGEIAVPIKLGEAVLGVLDVQSDKVNALNENDQLLLEGLCGQIGVAIESTQLQQEMENRLRELNTLQRYMSREGWQSYRKTNPQTTGFLYDKAGVQPLEKDKEVKPGQTLTQSSNGHIDNEPQILEEKKRAQPGLVDLPLVIRGESIGALAVEDEPDKELSADESEFLHTIAVQVAEALEAARLFEQTQDALTGQERLASELRTVAEVGTAASTILEVDKLLQTVVELVKLRFGLYHAHIYLVDESNKALILRAGAGDVGQIMVLEGQTITFDADTLVARSARTQKGYIENDVRKIIEFLPHPLLPDTRAEMAVPLIVGGKLIGVLDLHSDQVDFFSEEAMQVQRTLSSQIAVAVQNASMYADQVETSSQLRQVDKLKSEFLASMSHELRTPLNSIIGFADVLLEGLDGELNERMEQDVRLIRDSGTHLRDLIGDILDMSKIEAGRMELRYEEVDMAQMANDILATAGPLAKEKKLDLILDLDKKVECVMADRTRVRQVLWNIMGNAIKFTEKGSVTLSMRKDKDIVRVSVRDTGIGIKPEHLPIVFEQFRQVDGSLNRNVGGTGLGMSITKKLIELHGGEIGVESVADQGSTFWFTLPIEQPESVLNKPRTGPLPQLDNF